MKALRRVFPTGGARAPLRGSFLQRKCACGGSAGGSGQCEDCRKKDPQIQRKATSEFSSSRVPPIVQEVLPSPGHPLDAESRAFFEPRFGHDFGSVRIHSDTNAMDSARALHARAFAVGEDIAISNAHDPLKTLEGRSLLSHELAHVVQQRNGNGSSSSPDDLEREANYAASVVSTGRSVNVFGRASIAQQPQLAPDPDTKHPDEKPTPAQFIKKYSLLFGLKFDTYKIASDLYLLAWQSPDHYKFVLDVFKQLDADKRIEVADAFFRQLSDETLKDLAKTSLGPSFMKAIAAQLPKENSQRWRAEKTAVQGPQEEREKERTEKLAALKKKGKTVDITIYTKYKGMDTAESLSESVAKGREARKETDVSFPMEEFDDIVAVLEEIAKQYSAKAFVRQLRLIGHGTKDQFGFGRDMYSSAYLKKNYKTGALAEYMADGATVALEGCDVAAGDAGLNYLSEIGRIFFGEKKSGYLKGNTCKALVIGEMTECGPRTLRWPSDFKK